MADTEVLSIRMPAVLKARVRAEVYKQGVKLSEFIADACRMRLDSATSSKVEHLTHNGQDVGSSPTSRTKPDKQALREICAGKITSTSSTPSDVEKAEISICGKTWWEDGEEYQCLMDAGHRDQKHGLRGMVQRL